MNEPDDEQPNVSVLIPAFNDDRFLGAAIDSVLAQSGVDFEIVVSDHASTDGTLEVARAYEDDARVRVVRAPAGGGAVANWNFALSHARAPKVKLLCADDTLRPGVLARQSGLLDADPSVALVACRRDVIDARGRVRIRAWGLRGLRAHHDGPEAVRRAVRSGTNPFGEPGCVMVRTKDLRSVGGWWGRFPYLPDLATYFKVLSLGDFARDDVPGATFRLSNGQESFQMAREAVAQMRGLSRWARHEFPAVRPADVAVGGTRARILAGLRSLTYVRLRRQMST